MGQSQNLFAKVMNKYMYDIFKKSGKGFVQAEAKLEEKYQKGN
jgi:hypothetical protein